MHLPHYNCLFVHIPKAAGNSIKHAFGIGWEDHKDIEKYSQILGERKLAQLFKFTFVRNPWDRLFSEYNFQRRKSQRADTVRLYLYKEDGTERNFREWVSFALANPRLHPPNQWGGKPSEEVHRMSPQWDWIASDDGLRVDFVGRLENMQEDFRKICLKVGLTPRRLKRKNRKLHLHYSRHYDQETKELVADYYRKDIEAFGYEFEGNPRVLVNQA